MSYKLISGVEMHQKNPTTFEIPSDHDKSQVKKGDFVKLMFEGKEIIERMWVCVTENKGSGTFTGTLDNTPAVITEIKCGDSVTFNKDHIIGIFE